MRDGTRTTHTAPRRSDRSNVRRRDDRGPTPGAPFHDNLIPLSSMPMTELHQWVAMLLAVCVAVPAHAADKKPNIVHIVADDLGWKDVGFNGCSDIRTPNIDKLAAGGAKFTQFYVQPMCTPTRACLMTGRYPFRYGLQTIVIPTAAGYGLDTAEWLMSQCLGEAGY